MTLGQLLTLAEHHQAAQQTGGRRPEPADGASLMGFASMQRR